MHRRALPLLNPPLVAGLGLCGALAIGFLMAHGLGPGVGATIAMLYAPAVLLNLALGIAMWVPITFIQYLPFVWIGPSAASALILLAWLGTLRTRNAARSHALHDSRVLIAALGCLMLWLTVSMAWAEKPSLVLNTVWTWYVAAAVSVIVLTTILSPRHVRLVVVAFVVGAAMSVALGLLFNGVAANTSDAIQTAKVDEGRLTGGSGDPNYLAAALVPAIILAGALLVTVRSAIARWGVLVAAAICGVGLAATQSRGGLLAAGVAALASVIVFKQRRLQVGIFLAVVVGLMGLWFASSPAALQRVTNFNGGGNGRSDLWHVASVIGNEHPLLGVGLGNFVVQEQKYVRRPGPITAIALIVDDPHVAHNVYLQMYAEDGLPGVVLLALVMLLFMRAAWRAAGIFDRLGQRSEATLARAVLIAQISTVVAFIFISDATDERIWVLYALGPVLYSLSRRQLKRPEA